MKPDERLAPTTSTSSSNVLQPRTSEMAIDLLTVARSQNYHHQNFESSIESIDSKVVSMLDTGQQIKNNSSKLCHSKSSRAKFLLAENFKIRKLLYSLSVKGGGKESELKAKVPKLTTKHDINNITKQVVHNCEQIVESLKQLNSSNYSLNSKSHALEMKPKCTAVRDSISNCDKEYEEFSATEVDVEITEEWTDRPSPAPITEIVQEPAPPSSDITSSSSTETIKADDRPPKVVVDPGTPLPNGTNHRPSFQRKPSVNLELSLNPTTSSEPSNNHHVAITTAIDGQSEENNEEILETLRQVVRICTKTDLSKRASASEVHAKLEAKMKNLNSCRRRH